MSPRLRKLARFCIWVALCFGLVEDVVILTASSTEDAYVQDVQSTFTLAEVCLFVVALLIIEGVLVFALIRLRDPVLPQTSVLQGGSSA